jgi:hypothetical protein
MRGLILQTRRVTLSRKVSCSTKACECNGLCTDCDSATLNSNSMPVENNGFLVINICSTYLCTHARVHVKGPKTDSQSRRVAEPARCVPPVGYGSPPVALFAPPAPRLPGNGPHATVGRWRHVPVAIPLPLTR